MNEELDNLLFAHPRVKSYSKLSAERLKRAQRRRNRNGNERAASRIESIS